MSSDFWAGYISGAAGIIIGNPLDLIKTRLQAGQVHDAHPTSVTSLKSTFDTAGTLVKGSTAPILGYGALNALLFVTYNRSLALLSSGHVSTADYLQIYIAGALGGLATFVVSTPTELVKVRAQLARHSTQPTDTASRSSSLWIAKETWKREGLRGLYLGGSVTAWRDAVGYGFYFCSYDLSKKLMASYDDTKAEHLSQWKIMLCGGLAGIVTWASIFPLDVIKTRVQSQTISPPPSAAHTTSVANGSSRTLVSGGGASSYGTTTRPGSPASPSTSQPVANLGPAAPRQSTAAIASSMYKNEGIGVFFRGLGICSVRAFIVNAVQWAVYEWVMAVLVPSRTGSSL